MTNAQIRAAILRIVAIKALREEEKELRRKVIKEMKKRRKEKLDLGGPSKEDYVCLRKEEVHEIMPGALLTNLEDKSSDAGLPRRNAMGIFLQVVQVQLGRLREVLGRSEADHLRSTLDTLYRYDREYLTYKISTDEKNQVRGIDL